MTYSFSSYLYKDENQVVAELLDLLDWSDETAADVQAAAIDLVDETRAQKGRGGQLEAFLQEFSLNTDEGLAMMCLAEALLRIPDAKTANALIKDKVVAANWLKKQGGGSKDWMAKAAGIGMSLTRKTLDSPLSRLGEPIIREAMIKAMQMMGKQFVLGTSIKDALSHARMWERQGYRMSYDMLGEGARDQDTAKRYFKAYSASIDAIAHKNKDNSHENAQNAGISVKLSALHPRYTYSQKSRCIPEVTEKLKALCVQAAVYDLPLTVDAEEMNRLDLSIAIIDNIFDDSALDGWDGFGLAVQAYQKRALPLIDYLAKRAKETGRKIQIRLVKGAYWDSEIKHAQMHGFPEYGVFTRKSNTDLSYLACAQALFSHADVIYPMFATHNAHTIVAIRHMAGKVAKSYEFQRLHGMGEGLYAQIIGDDDVKISVYAPVGPHEDLLPYLVRRLLENGANSSFVNQLLDAKIPAQDAVRDPVMQVRGYDGEYRHPSIPLPQNIFGDDRVNSRGIDLDDPASSQSLLDYIEAYKAESQMQVRSIIDGKAFDDIELKFIDRAFNIANQGFAGWNKKDVQERAMIIERVADLLEENAQELMAVLVYEAGKTIPDAQDELREAVDFCRYYAARAREDFVADGILMPGYTGESNRLTLQGRGVFVCISPWNFPLAIFTGQIVAALVSGNAVLAKSASQTHYIAMRTVELMHKAGVPHEVLHLFAKGREFGEALVSHKDVAGVVFTGSTATAKHIQKTLAVKNPRIVPFIAETGGQNAMIVDSSALPEQVVDDVIASAFGSAGQRCSALRVLYLQSDIADSVITILIGAMAELKIGDPVHLSTDVGYIIDENSKAILDKHVEHMSNTATLVCRAENKNVPADNDRLFMPAIYEIPHIDVLKEEVFGSVLHIIRYDVNQLDDVIAQINETGYGLTFGMHSRIQARQNQAIEAINAGNVYINRSMTGAVVGVQPFGGMALSGTGPKAGGPHYLQAFAVEKLVTIDTTASGGNAGLISMGDDA
ncbi:MAG: bifunctional proline dehydrogenase/L-glutamate gamma-semialdehyde dehydrogenase [Alphaproteobacteria bacterium]|nr:MAG: bifunctional proline dehydrogenase/L-glutamate gamma-semialdehyde dehydrogenase [Alphaproteobacteria bacterium]